MLGLCSGIKFALLTAGPFDVLLQSLPIVVSSHLICSRLSSLSLLICPLPFLASCVPHMVNSHTRTGCLRSQLERQYYNICCCISNNRTHFSFNFLTLQLYQPHTFSGTRGGFLTLQKHVLKAFQYIYFWGFDTSAP